MSQPSAICAHGGRLCTALAAAGTLYLAAISMAHTALPGCAAGSACQAALASPRAYWFGLPVSFAGFLLYAAALVCSGAFLRRERSTAGWCGMAALLLIPAGTAWFTGVQVLALTRLCLWCLAVHLLACMGAMLLAAARLLTPFSATPAASGPPRLRHITALVCASVILLGAGTFVNTPPPSARGPVIAEMPALPAAVTTPGDINPADFPSIGDSTAGSPALLLSDFTCAKSRALHAALNQLEHGPERHFHVSVLPAARTPEAEAIQRTMLTLWHIDPAKWQTAAALLTSGQVRPEPAQVELAARRIAGDGKFSAVQNEMAPLIDLQLAAAASLMQSPAGTPASPLPAILRDGARLSPPPSDAAALLRTVAGPQLAAHAPPP